MKNVKSKYEYKTVFSIVQVKRGGLQNLSYFILSNIDKALAR